MSKKLKQSVLIIQKEELQPGIISLWLLAEELSDLAHAGQFLAVYPKSEATLLPRPISICEIDQEQGMIRLVFRIVGKGTEEFSRLEPGDKLEVMGPLGNGYTLQGQKSILFGGGIGIPPMLELARSLPGEKTIVLGYRDANTFLVKEFKQYGKVVIATEDGSLGTKGNVIDAVRENQITGDQIFACGPMPMLRGIKQLSEQMGVNAQISLEERMACGIGACLGCVCKTVHKDAHSHVNNTRICTEGPVFDAKEVLI